MERNRLQFAVLGTALLVCSLSQPTTAYELGAWGYDGLNEITNLPAGSNFVAIAAGEEHGLALKADGTVVAWGGNNAYGQITVPASLGPCLAIGAGGDISLAIKADGTIAAWGRVSVLGATPSGTYTAVDAGESFAVALATDGSIVAWGSNTYGQVDVPAGTNFIQVVAGYKHAVALRSDNTVASWGYFNGTSGQPTSGTYTAVSAGNDFCLALTSGGEIVHWGDDPWDYGVDDVPTGSDFVAISAGYVHGLAIKEDGSAVGWGAGTTASGHPHWGQAAPPAANDYQAVSGGLYWSLSMNGENVVFSDGFESGGTSNWSDAVQ